MAKVIIYPGENTLQAAASALAAAQSAAYAGGFETPEYASQSAGNAATTAGQIFRVPLGTTPQTFAWYRRLVSGSELVSPLATTADLASTAAGKGAALVGTTSGGTVQSDLTARPTSAVLAASGGAALVGLTQGGNAQQGIRHISPDMKGAVSGVNSDASMTTWANAGKALATGAIDYQTTTTLFPQVQGMVIDGEGGTITNTNTTNISVNDQPNITTMIGYTNFISDNALTPYSIASVSGRVLTLSTPADSANFAVGDLIFVRGATFYLSGGYEVATYQTRARVEAVSAGVITLDRGLCEGLATDSPKIGNFAQGVSCGISGVSQLAYLWYAPKLQNLTLSSDQSNAVGGGGVVDGMFRNITTEGRNGWALNAMQDCLVDGLRFNGAWRKIVELAQGSSGTTVRNVRGTLLNGSTKFGGASDVAPFGCAINENSEDCTFEDFDVSSGPNDFGAANSGVLLSSGRRNKVRNSVFNFPALTGYGLTIQSNLTAGNPNQDCTYENITLNLPVGNRFINVGDAGSGIVRPTLRNIKAFGTVSSGRAVSLMGTDGVLENCWFQAGNLFRNGTITGWTIRGNYFPQGFDATIDSTTFRNNNIYDNDSAANRLAQAAALRFWNNTNTPITTTTVNNIFQSATFPAGSLAINDTIIVYGDFAASGTTANARNVRVSVTDGTPTTSGIGSRNLTTTGSLSVRTFIVILTDTLIRYETNIGGTISAGQVVVSSIAAGGLKVNLEAWVQANAGETIAVGYCEILPRKRGMLQLPSFSL